MNATPSRKFFDISPPGRAAPSATSKPVVTNRPTQPDPFLYQSPLPPGVTPPTLPSEHKTAPRAASGTASPVLTEQLDPKAILIQAGDFTPLKASKHAGRHVALVAMICALVLICAASWWLVSTM